MNNSNLHSIDLNDLQFEDDPLQLDPEADAFETPQPVPDGTHACQITLFRRNGESPFSAGKDKHGRPYIMASISGSVIAEGKPYNNTHVFDRVSTVVLSSSRTCRMAGLLRALGVPVPANTTARALAQMLETTLQGEPLVGIETQWQVRAQRGDTWKTILRGMRKFPLRADGSHNHVIDDPDTGEKLTAQATVLRYLPVEKVNR